MEVGGKGRTAVGKCRPIGAGESRTLPSSLFIVNAGGGIDESRNRATLFGERTAGPILAGVNTGELVASW